MTALISIAMIGGFVLIVFALAAFGVSARADSIAEQADRQRQGAAEWPELGIGGGADFHFHNQDQ